LLLLELALALELVLELALLDKNETPFTHSRQWPGR
jgi:hypothetical protein